MEDANASTVLPHDSYARDFGLFVQDNVPFVLASNVAGVVKEVGPEVSRFRAGDQVFGYSISEDTGPTPDQGGLQEYAVLPADALAKIPRGFSPDRVATIPTNLVTAWQALYTKFGLDLPSPLSPIESTDLSGETIVILAAGSNIGKFAVQCARIGRIGNIIAVASQSNEDSLLNIGATHFFDRNMARNDLVAAIHQVTGRNGIRRIFDCYNTSFELGFQLLSTTHHSKFVTTQPIDQAQAEIFNHRFQLCEPKSIKGANNSLRPYTTEFWDSVTIWVQEGRILPTRFFTIDGLRIDEINRALDGYRDKKLGPQAVVVNIGD